MNSEKKEESLKENATKINLIVVVIADGTELYAPSGLLHLLNSIDMGTSISTQIESEQRKNLTKTFIKGLHRNDN